MSRLHRVLAAVDYSAPARAAFDHALALSRAHGAELTVVHAVPTDWPFNWQASERRDLMAALRAAAEAAGVRVKISVQSGDPARVILLHAKARAADLVVLGSSERTGFDRFRFGSVAETVALKATQPVLVVPTAAAKAIDSTLPFKSIVVAANLGEDSIAAVERALAIASEGARVTVVDPSADISRVAHHAGADLVLVAVTPRSAIARMLFGSTAARVIRAAGVPVLTTPPFVEQTIASRSEEDQFAVAA